jgi:hypothetical protein
MQTLGKKNTPIVVGGRTIKLMVAPDEPYITPLSPLLSPFRGITLFTIPYHRGFQGSRRAPLRTLRGNCGAIPQKGSTPSLIDWSGLENLRTWFFWVDARKIRPRLLGASSCYAMLCYAMQARPSLVLGLGRVFTGILGDVAIATIAPSREVKSPLMQSARLEPLSSKGQEGSFDDTA